MYQFSKLIRFGMVGAIAVAWPVYASADDVTTVAAKAPFDEVKQSVADAIINRGYVIDYTAHIGDMLVRTGPDVGSSKKVFNGAESVQFCSAVLSRKMMEADPENIAYCPYVIFYYERADMPGTIHVGYRELDEDGSDDSESSKKAINVLLRDIIREASGAR